MLYHIYNKVYIQLDDYANSKDDRLQHADLHGSNVRVISLSQIICAKELRSKRESTESTQYFGSFSAIQRFCSVTAKMIDKDRDSSIVFEIESAIYCPIPGLFIIGCHLIMTHGLGFEETYLCFKPFHKYLKSHPPKCGESFEAWLRAFCCAKCLDWISVPTIQAWQPVSHTSKFILDDRYSRYRFRHRNVSH